MLQNAYFNTHDFDDNFLSYYAIHKRMYIKRINKNIQEKKNC